MMGHDDWWTPPTDHAPLAMTRHWGGQPGCPEARAEVSHADQAPVAGDPPGRAGLVGGPLPAARGVPGVLHRAVPRAAVVAHRRPAGHGARTGTGGRSTGHPTRKPHGPGRPGARHQHSHHCEPGGGPWATVVGLVTLVIGATAVF